MGHTHSATVASTTSDLLVPGIRVELAAADFTDSESKNISPAQKERSFCDGTLSSTVCLIMKSHLQGES